jgi:glucose-6-phosphate dehydrogenase assembly protein OpcA
MEEALAMSVELSSAGLGRAVEVAAIDGELKKLWEADDASTNASLMNFLIYTEDPSQLTANSETILSLTQENACRALLIAMDREAPEPSIEAYITAHCHLAHGKKSICSEQVSFLLKGKSLGRLRNTVFAHLNSDLPLVFWWQNELSDLFEEGLYRLLDRLIFDSSTWADPTAGFERIVAAREDTGQSMITQDLSWTRSYFFRLATAGLFDDPAAKKSFSAINKVKIVAQKEQRTAALLLLAWVVELSGWKLLLKNGDSFELSSAEGNLIEASIEWNEDGAPLSELSFFSPDCEIKITREKGNPHLCQSLCTDGHCLYFSGPADADAPADLVASQLSRGGKNSLFLRVLPQFFELL